MKTLMTALLAVVAVVGIAPAAHAAPKDAPVYERYFDTFGCRDGSSPVQMKKSRTVPWLSSGSVRQKKVLRGQKVCRLSHLPTTQGYAPLLNADGTIVALPADFPKKDPTRADVEAFAATVTPDTPVQYGLMLPQPTTAAVKALRPADRLEPVGYTIGEAVPAGTVIPFTDGSGSYTLERDSHYVDATFRLVGGQGVVDVLIGPEVVLQPKGSVEFTIRRLVPDMSRMIWVTGTLFDDAGQAGIPEDLMRNWFAPGLAGHLNQSRKIATNADGHLSTYSTGSGTFVIHTSGALIEVS